MKDDNDIPLRKRYITRSAETGKTVSKKYVEAHRIKTVTELNRLRMLKEWLVAQTGLTRDQRILRDAILDQVATLSRMR